MALRGKRWYRLRRNQILIISLIGLICMLYNALSNDSVPSIPNLDITRRNSVIEYIENRLQEALIQDKGTGCNIPELDPFAKEVTQFDKDLPKITCSGQDWVRCYFSECRVVQEILDTTTDIQCVYKDIIYESDNKYILGPPTTVSGNNAYTLQKSDHVKIKCIGKHKTSVNHTEKYLPSKWTGHSLGFRTTVERVPPPFGREDTINVLIFGFDSTARNGFIRRMPRSYEYLKNVLGATILTGYNIVGDGTPAALFPILTGKNELELPDVRKKVKSKGTLDQMPFIFYKLKKDGYRTAYFEDMPWIGTFQYRFNGFKRQPADHYLRSFYLEESNRGSSWWAGKGGKYCVGDTPRYKLMMNITDQFLKLDGKRFAFTFIADITHDNFNVITTADDDMVDFMKSLGESGKLKDTLLFVMGDHGPRYANVRDTMQGKLEERLPLMAIRLPEKLKQLRPDIQTNLEANAHVLTNPHDIHATILDALDWTMYYNDYKINGADLKRGLTLFEPIPKNRSCSEASIEPHWCACLNWQNVSRTDRLYAASADALVDYVNALTMSAGDKCVPRELQSVEWVMRQRANSRMLSFVAAKDADGYVGTFGEGLKPKHETYQLKIVVSPGRGVFEASMTYLTLEDRFVIDTRDISRTNAYNNEPSCISATHPHLNPYCYCND